MEKIAALIAENTMIPSVVAGLVSGLLLALFTRLALIAHARYRVRFRTRFWQVFANKDLSVIFTEYPPLGASEELRIAEQAGGKLMTKGMAMALRVLLDFVQKRLVGGRTVSLSGDKSGELHTQDFIVLGSPGCNKFAKMVYDELENRFEIPYWVDHDTLAVQFQDGTCLSPEVEDQQGYDYAVVLKAMFRTDPPRYVLVVGGCYMYGTQAAAEALTDPRFLRRIVRQTGKAKNITFLLRTPVINGNPVGATLRVEGKMHIDALRPRLE